MSCKNVKKVGNELVVENVAGGERPTCDTVLDASSPRPLTNAKITELYNGLDKAPFVTKTICQNANNAPSGWSRNDINSEVTDNPVINYPTHDWYDLFTVCWSYENSDFKQQTAIHLFSGAILTRYLSGTTWSAWTELAKKKELTLLATINVTDMSEHHGTLSQLPKNFDFIYVEYSVGVMKGYTTIPSKSINASAYNMVTIPYNDDYESTVRVLLNPSNSSFAYNKTNEKGFQASELHEISIYGY